jgi:drug/metabolite transporter (DMT)-like permease
MTDRPMTPQEWGILVVLATIWGTSFLAIALALPEVPPLTIVLIRAGFGASILLVILVLSGGRLPVNWAIWRQYLYLAIFNNVIPQGLIAWSEQGISSGYAAILNATTPMFAVIFAIIFRTGERLTLGRGLGVLAGIIGVGIMIGPDALISADNALWSQVACIAACASYAYGGIYGRRFGGSSPLVNSTATTLGVALIMLPLSLIFDHPWNLSVGLTAWAGLASLGFGSTGIAYLLYFKLLASAGATRLMLVTLISPIAAVILGAFFLNETIGLNVAIGFLVIALGLGLIDGRLKLSRRAG